MNFFENKFAFELNVLYITDERLKLCM